MRLNYTDVKWSEFRLTSEYARVLRATEIVTRYVFSFTDSEVLAASDMFYIKLTVPSLEVCGTADRVSLSYSAGVKDSVSLLETLSVLASVSLADVSVPTEFTSIRFLSSFSEASLATDLISCGYTLVIRDVVGYNESFFFGGRFNVDVNNIVSTSDIFNAKVDSSQPDVAAVAEFVRVGIRHMIDFYLGGFTIGSVVFGGRVR